VTAPPQLDERTYERLAAEAFRQVLDLFDDVEPEDADVEPAGDVIRIELRGGSKIVLNTQRPARQLWLAGGQLAWHFSYDPESQRWLDDKGRGELMSTVRSLAASALGTHR
jgi:CyaY protein